MNANEEPKDFLTRYSLPVFLALISLILLYVFRDYLFLRKLYLFTDIGSDTVNIYYPSFVHNAEYLRSEGLLRWSFHQGMGQNLYPGDIFNPFSAILYALGSKLLAYGIIYVECLKIILAGIIFYFTLATMGFGGFSRIVGALLFSFSGYLILGSAWYGHSAFIVYASLMILAFEKLFKQNSFYLFPIATFFLAGVSLFFIAEFLFVYALFRFVDEKGLRIKEFFLLLAKMTGLGLIGVGMSLPISSIGILQTINSPRVRGGVSSFEDLASAPVFGLGGPLHNYTVMARFFSSDILGIGDHYKGWYNYLEGPVFYIGLSALLLAPLVFFVLSRREKILYASFAGLWIMTLVFPFFRYAFYMFAGDYYKTGLSLFIPLVLVLFGLKTLDRMDMSAGIKPTVIFSILAVLLGFLFYQYKGEGKILTDPGIVAAARAFLIVYALLLVFFQYPRFKLAAKGLFLLAISLELGLFSFRTVNDRGAYSVGDFVQKKYYNDTTNDAVSYLNSIDRGFFRIEKDYDSSPAAKHGGYNDSKVQGYYGTKSYSSFNQQYYIRFLQEAGVITKDNETLTRWAPSLEYFPILQTFAGVKYYLSQSEKPAFLKYGYDKFHKIGPLHILKNRYHLPLGFAYDKLITLENYRKLASFPKQLALLHAFVIDENAPGFDELRADFPPLKIELVTADFDISRFAETIERARENAFEISSFRQNRIAGSIELEKKKLLFFSIPYDANWVAEIDGKRVKPSLINIGFMGFVLEKGHHDIVLKFELPYIGALTFFALMSLFFYIYAIVIKKYPKARNVSCRKPPGRPNGRGRI